MATIRASIDIELQADEAFDSLVEELAAGLSRRGIRFDPGEDGRLVQDGRTVGEVVAWTPGERVAVEWRHPDGGRRTEVEARLEPARDPRERGPRDEDEQRDATRVVIEHRDWGHAVDEPRELAGWFAGEVVAPLLHAMAPGPFGDWLTDRGARRPSGARSREIYRDPLYHYPNFHVILDELALGPDDHLLEVGCGGGALLKLALESGCRAAAVDHSPDMVRVAREENRDAVAAGRLEVLEARAESLPFGARTFTCAAMTGVLGFLADPVGVLGEIRRVLAPGGRLVMLGSDPELRGTPAAPEPMASRLRFYEDDELEELGRAAGFAEVRAVHRDLEPFAREVGVPDEHLPLFTGPARFLLARTRVD